MKMLKWFPIIFLCIGVALLTIAVALSIHHLRFVHRATAATGVVLENIARTSEEEDADHNKHLVIYYYPKVQFRSSDGRQVTFVSDFGSNPPHAIGASVKVLYDSADPSSASVEDGTFWIFPAVLFFVGAIFTPWPVYFLIKQRHRGRDVVWLNAHGTRIQTDFTRVEINPDVSVNAAHPYRVVSQWLDPKTNRILLFKSDDIWFDPHKYAEGKPIEVIVDPNDFSRYEVVPTFLPQVAEPSRPKSFKARLTGWRKAKIQLIRDRWKKLNDSSLDRRLYVFYTLCIWGLLWLDGALSIGLQLIFAAVLAFGLVQFALWQRFSRGWNWPEGAPGARKLTLRSAARKVLDWSASRIDTSWEVTVPGGIRSGSSSRLGSMIALGCVAALLIAAMFFLPISQPAFLGWYLWGFGAAAYIVLRALGLAAGTRAEFHKDCTAGSPTRVEARWKRRSRLAYQIVFCLAWLLCLGLFYLSGILGMPGDSSVATFIRTRLIGDHGPWISGIFLHPGLVIQLRNYSVITFAIVVAAMFVLHYALKVRLRPFPSPVR
jgi:hypothetical protein